MPRKSLRTATTTYRRRQLTWDNAESCNRSDDNRPKFSKTTASAAETTSDRLVTPSPRVLSTSNRVENNESPRKRSPRRKQLFTEKKTYRKKRLLAAITPTLGQVSLASEKSPTSFPKQLFPPPQTGDLGASSSGGHSDTVDSYRKGQKWRVSRKRSLNLTAKFVASKKKSGRYQKRNLMPGDSLATFISFKKTLPSCRNTIVCTIAKKICRKGLQRHSIGNITKNEVLNKKKKRFNNPRTFSLPSTSTTQHGDFSMTENNCTSSIDIDDERSIEKEKRIIPPELVSLLVSRARKRLKRTRARTTIEILNEFNKNKKELKSKKGTRASLPRACKLSKESELQKSLAHEDTDGKSEPKPEDNNDTNDDWTTHNSILRMKDPRKDEGSRKESIVTFGSSVNESSEVSNVSPSTTTLNPRPRELLSSSAFDGTQNLLRFASPDLNDDCEFDAVGSISRKRQRSKSKFSDSLQHMEVEILSAKVDRGKEKFVVSTHGSNLGRNTNPDPMMTEDTTRSVRKETSQWDSQVQVSGHSKRKHRRRLEQVTNDFDVAKECIPPSNMIANQKVSPTQGLQQLWKEPSTPSNHRHTQLSMEQYPLHSSDSNDEKSVHQLRAGAANSSPRVVMMKDSYIQAIDASSKASDNFSVLRRKTQQVRPQAYSYSPTELVSLSNGESRTREFLSRAKQHLGASPRRKKNPLQLKNSTVDEEVAASKKRVRFDSSTTTFSVKIKIKTNLDASSQNKNGSEYCQSVPFPSSLNESAVQAIANQVTQACLTQARTSTGVCDGGIVRTCENPGVNVDVDMNEKGEFCSHLSESSFNSNQSSDAEEESGDEKSEKFIHDMYAEKDASIVEAKTENCYLSRKAFDDGRSITSELTSDWNRPRPSRFNDQDHFEKLGKKKVHLVGKEHNVSKNCFWKDRDDTDRGPKHANGIEKAHFVDNSHHHKDRSMSNIIRSSHAISNTHRYRETQSHSPVSRRRRIKGCSDSLAGSLVGSIASVAKGDVSIKVPREVSLRNPSTGSMGRRSSAKKIDKMKYASTVRCVGDDANKEKRPEKSEQREVESTPFIPIAPSPFDKSRFFPFSPNHRCGNCKGCQRTFDCQTCDACLEKLRLYGSLRSPSMKEGLSPCLSRRCQRTCRIGSVDSLLGMKSSRNQLQSTYPSERINGMFTDKSLPYRKSGKNPTVTNIEAVQESQKTTLKTMKAPWNEGDDWTVDYSYLSEPGFHCQWGEITNSTISKKTSLSPRSLSTHSWWLPVNKKHTIGALGGGGRTTPTSVSELVASQKRSKKTIAPVSIPINKQPKGRRRGGKQKRDPLHGLALPSTSTDVCSVTSWRENRKCLRALMEYDEADQDWV